MISFRRPLLLIAGFLALSAWPASIPSPAFADDAPSAKAVEGKKAETADAPKTKNKDDEISGGRFAGDPIYVHIAPMILPVITSSGAEQLVTIILDIQVKDFDTADTLHSNMPRVMDALMRAFYGGLGQGTLRNGKLADVSKIKNKAIAAVSEVIGRANVRDVLVQGISQRML